MSSKEKDIKVMENVLEPPVEVTHIYIILGHSGRSMLYLKIFKQSEKTKDLLRPVISTL